MMSETNSKEASRANTALKGLKASKAHNAPAVADTTITVDPEPTAKDQAQRIRDIVYAILTLNFHIVSFS